MQLNKKTNDTDLCMKYDQNEVKCCCHMINILKIKRNP